MNSLNLRSSIALACALSVAGCGGGGGNLGLGGSVSGLTKPGLVLQNGADTKAIDAGATSFFFDRLLANDESFDVTVKTQPTAAVCTVTNGKGNTGAFTVTSVIVSCITNSYELGGDISGLDAAATGLVLNNGPERKTIPAGATSFTMNVTATDGTYVSGKVADGAPYGVTVLTQPQGKTCTVSNGSGTMGSAAVTNIQVKCV